MAILSREERAAILAAANMIGEEFSFKDPIVLRLEAIAGPDHDADNQRALADVAQSLSPGRLEGAEGGSGATDQGEPGRTLAAACPSLMLQPRLVTCSHNCGRVSMLEPQFAWWTCDHCAGV